MAVEMFQFRSLSEIDGGLIREAFEQALRRCRADCEDRPALAKARKVTLTAVLVPQCTQAGAFDTCDVQFEVDDSLPKRVSPKYNMKVQQGQLFYNEVSPDDVRQGTLDEVSGPQATVAGGE